MLMCSDTFEGVVRYIRHSPRVALGLQIFSWTLRALFMFNIVTSLLPLLRPRSRPLTTIPLTPAQRELIGLDTTGSHPSTNHFNLHRHHTHCNKDCRYNYSSSI